MITISSSPLGCAAENLIQAASANGLRGRAVFDAAGGDTLRVDLEPSKPADAPLFQAILERQSTRAEHEGKPLSGQELVALEKAGTGNGVHVMLLTERDSMEKVLEFVLEGNTSQVSNPAFAEELKARIRFSSPEAVRSGDGLYTASSGNLSVPSWLGSLLFGLFFTPESENDKYVKHVRSSAGIAIFVSDSFDRARWIEVGRCYERFALQSADQRIRNAFLNQPVEVSTVQAAAGRTWSSASAGAGDCPGHCGARYRRCWFESTKEQPGSRQTLSAALQIISGTIGE